MFVMSSLILCGCATIIHGTQQMIEVSSSPSGARVRVDNNEEGTTPLVVNVNRRSDHKIQIDLVGYERAELIITNRMSGWVWGNLIFLPLVVPVPIGVVVDFIGGGIYTLTVDQLYTELQKEGLSVIERPDDVLFFVVLNRDP